MNVIETARLALRELRESDAPFMLQLLNEHGFLKHIGDRGVRTLEEAGAHILRGPVESYRRFGYGLYLTSVRRDGKPVGICGFVKREALPDADIGFALLAAHCGKGYASEAAAGVLEYGRTTLGLRRIVAITAPGNRASVAVLLKLGLRLERRIRLAEDGAELDLFGSVPGQDS